MSDEWSEYKMQSAAEERRLREEKKQKVQKLRRKIIDHVLLSCHADDAGDYVLDIIDIGDEIRELSPSDLRSLLGEDPSVLEFLEDKKW